MEVTYKTALVYCAKHKIQSIITGCLCYQVMHDADDEGTLSLVATNSKCSCKARVIPGSENESTQGRDH